MWTLYYLCSFRPVWYEAGEYATLAAAIVAAAELHGARRGAPVEIRDPAGLVRFRLPQ